MATKAPAKKTTSTAKKAPAKKVTKTTTATKKTAAKKSVAKVTKASAKKSVSASKAEKDMYNTNVSILLCLAIESLILLLGYLIIINA